MNIPTKKRECHRLIEFLETLGPTEWRSTVSSEYLIRLATGWEVRSQIEYPPTILFRFDQDRPEVISRLHWAILSYRGTISWVLEEFDRGPGKRSNWVIMPRRLLEVRQRAEDLDVSPKEYMVKYEPGFGAIAYHDVAGLTEHVINFFERGDFKKSES